MARIGLRTLRDELLSRFEYVRLAGPPQRLCFTFVPGYEHVHISARSRRKQGRGEQHPRSKPVVTEVTQPVRSS